MSSEVEEEERRALIGHDLDSSTLIVHQNEDTISICHLPQSNHTDTPSLSLPNQRQRLSSLDVFRGLTVALMILVDNVGRAFPSLNHSPWFGVTLADFVMPFFLFVVGVSIGLVFQKVSSKSNTTKKVISRTLKLFLLGLLLQGGYFHGRGKLTYGVDLSKIRWLGVLQRISIGYFLASISEIWLVNHNILVDSPAGFVRKYSIQWMFSILLCSVCLCLLYGLYVPNWKFKHSNLLWSSDSSHLSIIQNVHCEVRGSLEPPCNVVGFIDRLILGEDHMYQRPVYIRTKECSVNSPDYGPLPPDSPGWCLAPFDPEGILSSLMAAITCFMGLQYGHIIVHLQGHKQRVLLWSVFSFSLLLIGYILEILGMPLSKALYTLSYTCITAGASGLVLTAIYYIVDIEHLRKPTVLLQWMGMNALVAYALAACDIFPAVIQGFYWHSPENNLVDASEALMQIIFHSKRNLSRHQLGDLQSKMFPDYFLMLGVCCAVSVTSFDYLHPWKTSSTTERFQLGFLFSSFTFNLANLFVFAPMIIEMMKQRHKMEKENNIGEEELWSNNVEVAAMNKKFRMIHGLSSRASIMSIGCLAIHSCYLAGKIGL